MKKVQAKKLGLSPQTIRVLDDATLVEIAGGTTACLVVVPPSATVSIIAGGCKAPTLGCNYNTLACSGSGFSY
jgi:hypothetical protein